MSVKLPPPPRQHFGCFRSMPDRQWNFMVATLLIIGIGIGLVISACAKDVIVRMPPRSAHRYMISEEEWIVIKAPAVKVNKLQKEFCADGPVCTLEVVETTFRRKEQ